MLRASWIWVWSPLLLTESPSWLDMTESPSWLDIRKVPDTCHYLCLQEYNWFYKQNHLRRRSWVGLNLFTRETTRLPSQNQSFRSKQNCQSHKRMEHSHISSGKHLIPYQWKFYPRQESIVENNYHPNRSVKAANAFIGTWLDSVQPKQVIMTRFEA